MKTDASTKQLKVNHITLKPLKEKHILTSYVVLTQEEKMQLKELNTIMSKAINVLLWNDLRRKCKKRYSQKLISVLDASGLISKTLKALK
jgi:hypothetical protein